MPLLIALAVALMLGLLGMHVLGGHESAHASSGAGGHADALAAPAAHAHPDGVVPPPHQPAGAPASDADAHADAAVVPASYAAEHGSAAAPADAVAPATCAGCADLPALKAACVLALLGGILLLVLPAGWRMPSPPLLPLTRVRADVVRPRAPSLHILCISRT